MSRRLQAERKLRESFNTQFGYSCSSTGKRFLVVHDATHEFDLFDRGRLIGGITTGRLWVGNPRKHNTSMKDRTIAEIHWLTQYNGNEDRVLLFTDHDLSKYAATHAKRCKLKISVYHFDGVQFAKIKV